ncbi:MAG: hypothetical protein R3D84_17945 [Paracoccaceae bacterium]
MRWFLAALILALTVTPLPAAAEKPVNVITNDGGGNVDDYLKWRAIKARKYSQVQILGRCNSACTMYLTLPNACIGPKAIIGFHGTLPKTGIWSVDYWLDMRVGNHFRGEMRRRFEKEWRHHGGPNDFVFLNARQVRKLDPKIPECPPRPAKTKTKKKTGG